MGERVFGPLFGVELLRLSRGGGPFLLRIGFGAALLAWLLGVLASLCANNGVPFLEALVGNADLGDHLGEHAAGHLARTVLFAQVFAVWLVVPGYVVSLLPGERAARVLELTEAAGISAGTAIAGKLAARAIVVGGALLTAIPVIALAQVWGGISLAALLAAEMTLVASACTVGAVALACSLARLPMSATLALAYTFAALAAWPAFTVAGMTDRPLSELLSAAVGLTVGSVVVAVALLWASAVAVRGWTVAEWLATPAPIVRPADQRECMGLWERQAEEEKFEGWAWSGCAWGGAWVLLSCLACLPPEVWRVVFALDVAVAMGLVAVRAAGSIAGERDRRTLDLLLATPISRRDVAAWKLAESLYAARWPLLVGMFVAVGTVALTSTDRVDSRWTGAVVAGAQVVFVAAVGLRVSVGSPSTTTALARLAGFGAAWAAVAVLAAFELRISGVREALTPVIGPAVLLAGGGVADGALLGSAVLALAAGQVWASAWQRLERGET